jgi:hypothetical protein
MDVRLVSAGDELQVRNITTALHSILPLLERFGVATAEEVDVDTSIRRTTATSFTTLARSCLGWAQAWPSPWY